MRDAVKQHLPVSRPPCQTRTRFPIVSSHLGSTPPPIHLSIFVRSLRYSYHPLFWCPAPFTLLVLCTATRLSSLRASGLRHCATHPGTPLRTAGLTLPPRPLSSLASGACPMGTITRLSDLWVRLGSFGMDEFLPIVCMLGFPCWFTVALGFLGSSWRVVYGGPPCGICFFTHLSLYLRVFMLAAWGLDRGGGFVVYILSGDVTDLYRLNKE